MQPYLLLSMQKNAEDHDFTDVLSLLYITQYRVDTCILYATQFIPHVDINV